MATANPREADIPAEYAEAAKAAHEELVELVAEGKDDLMEEFFEKGTLPEEHIVAGLDEEMREMRVFPIALHVGPAQHRLRPAARSDRRSLPVARSTVRPSS